MRRQPAPAQPKTDALLGDGSTLRDILALAGPDIAPRLLRQIDTDLTATARQLGPALAASDWSQIRSASHVLISLAGTIGAMGLHADALALNEAAHAQDAVKIARLGPSVLSDLDRLAALMRLGRHAP